MSRFACPQIDHELWLRRRHAPIPFPVLVLDLVGAASDRGKRHVGEAAEDEAAAAAAHLAEREDAAEEHQVGRAAVQPGRVAHIVHLLDDGRVRNLGRCSAETRGDREEGGHCLGVGRRRRRDGGRRKGKSCKTVGFRFAFSGITNHSVWRHGWTDGWMDH